MLRDEGCDQGCDQGCSPGCNQDMDFIESEFRKCREDHYRRNDHHPEYFRMPFESRMQLTCDLLGTVRAWGRENNMDLDLAECRAFIEAERLPHWRHAVADKLPAPSQTVPDFEIRHYRLGYDIREKERLEDDEDVWIENLECVQDYVRDAMLHKHGVLSVWREIVEKYDERFESIGERIQNHDLDKFRPDMIRAYTKKFSVFNRMDSKPEFRPERVAERLLLTSEAEDRATSGNREFRQEMSKGFPN